MLIPRIIAAATLAAALVWAEADANLIQAPGAGSAPGISLVQKSTPFTGDATGVTTWNTTFSGGTTAGNIVLVDVAFCSTNSCNAQPTDIVSSVTVGSSSCSLGKFYGPTVSGVAASASAIWVCPNINAGQTTITVNTSTNAFFGSVKANEFSGAATTSPLDGALANTNENTASSGTVSVSTNGTTAQSSELIYGYAQNYSGTTRTLTGQQTVLDAWNGDGHADQYTISGAAGTTPLLSWTFSVSGGAPNAATGVIVAIKHP